VLSRALRAAQAGAAYGVEAAHAAASGVLETAEARELQPSVVFVDADNRVVGTGHDPAEALPGTGLVRGDAPAR
jgi:aspartate 1-decarboxylase